MRGRPGSSNTCPQSTASGCCSSGLKGFTWCRTRLAPRFSGGAMSA
eukprot:CAMPEP_0206142930 /NCGR_PEP_ID=MMETSP1473-20131121/18747_1 /ASSEMBLY_ACC=CAM_ASM_001109 /TAXON_ID=1461547 /ORGANISM="Stichococcus sp, Strain RCC1054" /LENGTH=45 /DNA_ID= /DNA_START= /DNA_END= /DNA_ORIENTATION=